MYELIYTHTNISHKKKSSENRTSYLVCNQKTNEINGYSFYSATKGRTEDTAKFCWYLFYLVTPLFSTLRSETTLMR